MKNDKYLLFKHHPCARGLNDEACLEISDRAELVTVQPGEFIQRSNASIDSVFLVIHGRLKQEVYDVQGNTIMVRYQLAGGQYGGIAASLGEPIPVDCTAIDPSTLLKFDYSDCLELTKNHEQFRVNWFRVLAGAIKQTLFQDRSPVIPRMIAVFYQPDMPRDLTDRLLQRFEELGESPCLLTDEFNRKPIEGVRFRVARDELDEQLSREEIHRQVIEWSADSKRTVFELSATYDSLRAQYLVEVCDQIFWCVTPDNWQESIKFLKGLQDRALGWRSKIHLVWLLDGGEVPLADELRALVHRDFKVTLAPAKSTEGYAFSNGLARLVQYLRGIQIGVALGGGAARGMAHLGVLKALEDHGIVVDRIAGTSAGAMTGTMYGSGMQVDDAIDNFVRDLRPSWFFRCMPRGEQWYLLYKYRTGQFDPMLRKYLGAKKLEQLPIPIHSVAVDLISGNTVVRDTGDAVNGIIESINLPVLAPPINREGQALVDGGLINNVPADVLVSRGCNFVIAVSVTNKMEHEFAKNRPDTPTSKMKNASTLQTVLRSYLVQSVNMNSIGVQPADIVIEPDVSSFELTEFTKTDQLSAVGEATTIESVEKIKKMLSQLDDRLYPSP